MAERPTRVVLVGFMGSGKTSVGRVLARRLGYGFEDMDRRIEERTGRAVAEIFRDDGEEAFREMEREEAQALASLPGRVVATGGGAFTRPATRALLQEGALTVWLRCDLERILARIPADGSRPLAGNRDIMPALLAEREPSYRMADVAVDASAGSPREVADRIVGLLEGRKRKRTSARR
ncbi:MAG TPA: shikimate kinase [Vicinamibacteria bacterium]|nr:shikimate kinase [Vicinamibacteria bacterium]